MTKQPDFEPDICNPREGGDQSELLYSEFNTSLSYLRKLNIKKKKDKVGAHTPCITSLSQAALRTHPFITNKSFCVSILRKCFHTVQMVVVLFEEYYFLNLHTSAMPWLLCIFFVYLYGFLKSVCLPAFML